MGAGITWMLQAITREQSFVIDACVGCGGLLNEVQLIVIPCEC